MLSSTNPYSGANLFNSLYGNSGAASFLNGPDLSRTIESLRQASDSYKSARQAEIDAITGGREQRPQFSQFRTGLGSDKALYESGLRNAQRNLAFANVADDTLATVRDKLSQARDIMQDLADGVGTADGVADEQATLDQLFAEINQAAGTEFAGRSVFGQDAVYGPIEPRNGPLPATGLTDNDGRFNFDRAPLDATGAQQNYNFSQGAASRGADGYTLEVTGNSWATVQLEENVTVTDDMYLEFEFKIEGVGEIQGISLENNTGPSSNRTFKAGGTQNYGMVVTPDSVTADGYGVYRVKVTDRIAAGQTFDRLVFVNDQDNNSLKAASGSSFRNVRLVEDTDPVVVPPVVTPPTVNTLGSGLTTDFYNGRNFETFVRSEVTTNNFNYGGGGPGGGVGNDDFSIRSEGSFRTDAAGTYQFRTRSDDGIRVYIDGNLEIDNWTNHGPTYDYTSTFTFGENEVHDIRVEYYERGGGSVNQLQWNVNGSGFGAIDAANLYERGAPNPVTPGFTTPGYTIPGGDTPLTFQGDLPEPPVDPSRDDGRTFGVGPAGYTHGQFDVPLTDLRTDYLGDRSGQGSVADLGGASDLNLENLEKTNAFGTGLQILDAALAEITVNQGAVDGMKLSMQAEINVAESALKVNANATERADAIEAAAKEAEEARLKLAQEARWTAATLLSPTRMNLLDLLQ